ncbi:MAG TPA: PHP domain-containing protein [Candidatus Saccharimonadales bacterium]|nr:PHP domain-containing protein [Candidatus Saccharimonadales bacterium]
MLSQPHLGGRPVPSGRVFVDLHCHTNASFDSLSDPRAVARAASTRGLTHLAITDHDRIDAAVTLRDSAPDGLTIIVGEEVKTANGDLICLFLTRPVPPGRPVGETIAAVRDQGGLVGIPHPFDRFRNSVLREEGLASLAGLVDWVEAYNARLLGNGNERAAAFARVNDLPGIAVSDAHSLLEVGVAYTVMNGNPGTPEGLREALATAEMIVGRASYVTRALTPVAKLVQRARGNRRVPRAGEPDGSVSR